MKLILNDGISITVFEKNNKVATENEAEFAPEATPQVSPEVESQALLDNDLQISPAIDTENDIEFSPDVDSESSALSQNASTIADPKNGGMINFAPSLKLEVDNLMPPSMSIPELIGMQPDSAEIDLSGTIIRFWDCGYQHRQHKNGAEELIHDGRTIRQIEAGHTSCDFWVQHEYSYHYEDGAVSSLTMKSLDGANRIQTYKLGDEADLDGPMSRISEIITLTGEDAGYQIVFEDGRKISAFLRGGESPNPYRF